MQNVDLKLQNLHVLYVHFNGGVATATMTTTHLICIQNMEKPIKFKILQNLVDPCATKCEQLLQKFIMQYIKNLFVSVC